jgi:hypothetical protein
VTRDGWLLSGGTFRDYRRRGGNEESRAQAAYPGDHGETFVHGRAYRDESLEHRHDRRRSLSTEELERLFARTDEQLMKRKREEEAAIARSLALLPSLAAKLRGD